MAVSANFGNDKVGVVWRLPSIGIYLLAIQCRNSQRRLQHRIATVSDGLYLVGSRNTLPKGGTACPLSRMLESPMHGLSLPYGISKHC